MIKDKQKFDIDAMIRDLPPDDPAADVLVKMKKIGQFIYKVSAPLRFVWNRTIGKVINALKPKIAPKLQQKMDEASPRIEEAKANATIAAARTWTFLRVESPPAMIDGEPAEAPEVMARKHVRFGMRVLFVTFVVFGFLSVTATLESASIATGKVSSGDEKFMVQHERGGTIAEILIKEGDRVKAGDKLLRLQNPSIENEYKTLAMQVLSLMAEEARLVAERDNLKSIRFSKSVIKNMRFPEVKEAVASQRKLFKTRRKAIIGELDVLIQQKNRLELQIEGLQSELESARSQEELLSQEIESTQKLYEKGHMSKTRLMALQRTHADVKGRLGRTQASIDGAHEQIKESELQMLNIRNNYNREVAERLEQTQRGIADLQGKLSTARQLYESLTLVAGRSGVVKGFKHHSAKEVVSPGEEIMEIIPQDVDLVVEAQVKPEDIDVVRQGLKARIRLSAFGQRNVQPLEGSVERVSADIFEDQRTGQSYYKAMIKIDPDSLNKSKEKYGIELYHGMQAEVLIVTGSKTILSFLLDPIAKSAGLAFRES